MTVTTDFFEVRPVGVVESVLVDPTLAPLQADEGGFPAWLVLDDEVRDAVADIAVVDRVTVVTWLHLARRDVLRTHPRGDPTRAQRGVFSTRSQDRPNPIGLHMATITARDDMRLGVDHLEAVDETPVLDIKIAL